MAKIAISELQPAGADLFDGSESYLQELTDTDLNENKGGKAEITPTTYFIGGVICGAAVGYLTADDNS